MTSALQERLNWVHPDDPRYHQVRSWYDRALAACDPFEQFFFAYLALVVAARIGTEGAVRFEERAIKDHLDDVQDEIPAFVDSVLANLRWFSARSLREGEALLDLSENEDPVDDRRLLASIRSYVVSGEPLPNWKLAKALATLVIRVRNNLFHGAKDYGSGSDREVLAHTNPIVLGLVKLSLQDAPARYRP